MWARYYAQLGSGGWEANLHINYVSNPSFVETPHFEPWTYPSPVAIFEPILHQPTNLVRLKSTLQNLNIGFWLWTKAIFRSKIGQKWVFFFSDPRRAITSQGDCRAKKWGKRKKTWNRLDWFCLSLKTFHLMGQIVFSIEKKHFMMILTNTGLFYAIVGIVQHWQQISLELDGNQFESSDGEWYRQLATWPSSNQVK